jgi:hypothetical protein
MACHSRASGCKRFPDNRLPPEVAKADWQIYCLSFLGPHWMIERCGRRVDFHGVLG